MQVNARVLSPIPSPIQLIYLACIENTGSWEITVDYCKLNQVMTPIAVAVPDVVSLPKQINTSPGSSYVTENASFCPLLPQDLLIKPTRGHLLSAGQASNTPSLSYLRVLSAPQLNITLAHYVDGVMLFGPGEQEVDLLVRFACQRVRNMIKCFRGFSPQ